ncbi:hypothetical protein PR202_gb20362 [Eleusine coracana subsp. coracana]|uniref:Wall-associated receptor kinase galacturonan-binding domain-containing protein n=1 Tax=Eleusine coracana subsp. coracana TaxID=191504 RepID=A0AAV5FA76_ELECO|nr:hypothetical protein PR202_gb20362 [Eleusine coracana subsp. coracana]
MASVLLVGVATVLYIGSISAQPAPGCQTHCGGVKIPYPFGIGANCAMEKRFEINCTNTVSGQSHSLLMLNLDILLQLYHRKNG